MTQSYVNENSGLSKFLSKAYLTVALGVFVSAIFALIGPYILYGLYLISPTLTTIFMFGSCIAELGIAIYLNARIDRMSKTTAWVCYIAYAVLTGISFSSICTMYLPGSVALAFISTAVMFICMAIIGRTSSINYSKAYMYLLPFFITSTIVTLLNAFVFHSAWVNMLIVYAGLILFLFITAADAKRLTDYYYASYNEDTQAKMMIIGSFALYLDFVNLFIKILQVFGRRRNSKD